MRGIKVELTDPDIESRENINIGDKNVPLCNESGFSEYAFEGDYGNVHCMRNS